MAEALLDLASRPDGLTVTLLSADGAQTVATALVSRAELDHGRPDHLGPDGQPLTVARLTPDWVAAQLPQTAASIGAYLSTLALPGPVATAWRALRDAAVGDGLTTLLRVHPPEAGAPDLRGLPWELLYDGGLFLFRDQGNPMALRLPISAPLKAAPHWPLRMLVLVGPTDADIAWEAEVLAVRRALLRFSLRIDLTIRKAPLSKADTTAAIKDLAPHVLHFIGHGRAPLDPQADGELVLGGDADPVPWQRGEIRAALTALKAPPRIVVINACEGAGLGGGRGTAAIADAFADLGCAAVIAMRGKIPGLAATCFSAAFYGALAETGIERPDLAYAHALQAVSAEPTNGGRVWSLPRLYFQRGVADVFPGLGDSRGFRQCASAFTDLMQLRPFVDRDEERAQLYHAEDCWFNQSPQPRSLLLVKGEPEVGKSWFLKGLVYVASLRGWRTFYWDFEEPPPDQGANSSDQRHYELEDVLRALREGQPWPGVFFARPPWSGPPGADPFADLDDLLGAAPGTAPRGDEDTKSPKAKAFVRGLGAVAKEDPGRPLLIALDHLPRIVPEAWNRYLMRELVLPLARGQLGPEIRLAIAGTSGELSTYGLATLQPPPAVVPLAPFPRERYEDLMFQFLLHFLESDDEQEIAECRDTAKHIAKRMRSPSWKPNRFAELAGLIDLQFEGGKP